MWKPRRLAPFAAAILLLTAGSSLSLPAPVPESPPTVSGADVRAAEAAVLSHTADGEGFFLDDSRGSPAMLERLWLALRGWASEWLARHPAASSETIATAAKAATGLEVSALRLDRDSFVVSAATGGIGTVFILRHVRSGRFATALALDQPATWGGEGPRELAAWRSDRANDGCRRHRRQADWSICGPLNATLIRLPDEADGARRFAVSAFYSQIAGATVGYQVSIWRWTGKRANPLMLRTYAQMIDDPVADLVGPRDFEVHEKANFKSMFSCGGCSGRQVVMRFDLPARGVRFVGRRSQVPDLDAIDDVYDRLLRSLPIGNHATPDVMFHLKPQVRALLADARHLKSTPSLGMIMGWTVTTQDRIDTLCLDVDAVGPQIFTIETRARRKQITAVREAPDSACNGPGSRS